MTVFCDTSVLVASCVRQHPHFSRSWPILDAVAHGRQEGYISCHIFAEVYSSLTSLPIVPKILPTEAERIIFTNIRPHFRSISITASMYEKAIDLCVRQSLPGGKIYDALLLECARKAQCELIYTFNLSDFRKLAPDLSERIAAP